MPNYVRNVVEFTGDKEKIRNFFNFIKTKESDSEEYYFDFNKLIPMPESLNIEESSDTEIAHHIYCKINNLSQLNEETQNCNDINSMLESELFMVLKKSAFKNFNWSKEEIEQYIQSKKYDVLELGKTVYENIENYGCPTAYEWHVKNWRTKWNSFYCTFDDENSTIRFSTAWASPLPIAHKIAEMFPELSFV